MKEIESIKELFEKDIISVKTNEELVALRNAYLGKSGHITNAMKLLKDMSVEEKKAFGVGINILKSEIDLAIDNKKSDLANALIQEELNNMPKVDLTVPSTEQTGSLHPVTIIQQRLINVFRGMGFVVEDGNEVETEYNNFEAVNIPKHHPARDMQDTFYLNNGQLLKTHTSAMQNKVMKKYGAPLKAIFPGRCFRNEELDASHENTFFQMEGMMILHEDYAY